MTTGYIKTLFALTSIWISTTADQCAAQQYAQWEQTPIIVSANRDTFSELFRTAESETVRIAMFGDSQEAARGAGFVYVPAVNLEFNNFYGNTPETPVIFPFNEGRWLYTSFGLGASEIRTGDSDLLPGQGVGTFDSSSLGLLASLSSDATTTPFANNPNQREFDTRNVGIEIIGANSIGSGEIEWRVNVQPDDGPRYGGGTDIASGVTNLGLGNSNSGYSSENIGSFQIPDGNDNLQVIARGDSQSGTQIAGVRFSNLDDPSGVAVQSFSQGGFTLQRLLNDHANAEVAFDAFGDYDAITLHFGTNDSLLFGFRDPEIFEDSLIETINRIRGWAGNDDLPIILAADPDAERGTAETRGNLDLYPGVAASVASQLNNVLALNSRRLAAEELGWIAGTDTIDAYLSDTVHYTELGAQELARLEVAALVGLAAVPEPTSGIMLIGLFTATCLRRKRRLVH